jgi:hypothetical protein
MALTVPDDPTAVMSSWTILGKLIADHLACDINVDSHLIVMHHEFSSCRVRHEGQARRLPTR